MLIFAFIIASFFPPYTQTIPAYQLAPGAVAGSCFVADSEAIPQIIPAVCNGGTTPGRITPSPTCVIGASGTTCTSAAFTPPSASAVCTSVEQTASLTARGITGQVTTSAPGATDTVTMTLSTTWPAGGTVAFNVVCL